MEPQQPFSTRGRPIRNLATNGHPHTNGTQTVTPDDAMSEKTQIMLRIQELEKHNQELKSSIEQRKKEIAENTASYNHYICMLAHDLKSPFSTVNGVLGLLKECVMEKKYSEMEEFIDIASSSVFNTTNLIENILAWVRSQNHDKRFNPIRINLAMVIKQVIGNNSLALKLKRISLSHSVPENFNVRADNQMIQSIIRNLITNAIKFTHPGGHITISATHVKQFIEVSVKDDGIGISAQQQQELLKPNDENRDSNVKGKGLGLVLCQEFIGIHGGSLRLQSRQGIGSSFIFTLPACD